MPLTIYAQPDNGPAAGTTVPTGHGWVQAAWAQINEWAAAIPGWFWACALATLLLFTIVSLPLARRLAYTAGARVAGKTTTEGRRDRRLLIAVLTPAVAFWLAVLVGSGRSLVGFGRTDLNWTGGWEYLVPLTLDGVAVAFGALAFRAIAKERNPDRAYRVVWMATATSAVINYFHEVGGSALGAGYLAVLSLFGMLIFHELLAQFEEGAAWIKRTNPKFGLRWITWPTNTLCAWVAWRNYPPTDGTDATIAVAVEHLERVRHTKTTRRAAEIDTPMWWMRFAPWTNIRVLRTALETERTSAGGSVSKLSATVTDLTARLDRQAAQFRSERASAAEFAIQSETRIRDLHEQRVAEVERLTAEHAAGLRLQRETLTAEMVQKVAAAKAEASLPHLDDRRRKTPGDRAGGTPKAGSPKVVISDEDAVQKLLAYPGDPEKNIPAGNLREWSQKAITEEAGVGYGRAPRLLEMVTEAQRQLRSETPSGDRAVNQ